MGAALTAGFFYRTIAKISWVYILCGTDMGVAASTAKNARMSYLQSIIPRTDGLRVSFCSTALRNNTANKLFS